MTRCRRCRLFDGNADRSFGASERTKIRSVASRDMGKAIT